MKCPICEKDAMFVGVHDDEGNYHGLVGCDYESNPWSGLSYALHHEGWGECPLCTDGAYSTMGGMLFDTAEEAINALTPPNEWVSVEERLPDKPGHYLVCTSVNYWHGGCMDKNGVGSNKGTTNGYVGTTLSVLDCFFDTTGNWNRVCNKHVTHWMNIPAPPGSVAKNETTESNEPLTPEDSNKNIEKVDNEEKLYNFVFLEHQREGYGKKYLFQCPLNIKLKKGQDVACETKYGGTNGICVTDSFIVSENIAKTILLECGGSFPPKNITGTAKIETKKVYVPF